MVITCYKYIVLQPRSIFLVLPDLAYNYYLTVSMGQESERGLAGYLWLEVSHGAAGKPSVKATVLCEDSTEERSTSKLIHVVIGSSPSGPLHRAGSGYGICLLPGQSVQREHPGWKPQAT